MKAKENIQAFAAHLWGHSIFFPATTKNVFNTIGLLKTPGNHDVALDVDKSRVKYVGNLIFFPGLQMRNTRSLNHHSLAFYTLEILKNILRIEI